MRREHNLSVLRKSFYGKNIYAKASDLLNQCGQDNIRLIMFSQNLWYGKIFKLLIIMHLITSLIDLN